MKHSDIYRNADNCSQLAEVAKTDPAKTDPARQRFKCIEASWRALATERDWLYGQIAVAKPSSIQVRKSSELMQAAKKRPRLGAEKIGAASEVNVADI